MRAHGISQNIVPPFLGPKGATNMEMSFSGNTEVAVNLAVQITFAIATLKLKCKIPLLMNLIKCVPFAASQSVVRPGGGIRELFFFLF